MIPIIGALMIVAGVAIFAVSRRFGNDNSRRNAEAAAPVSVGFGGMLILIAMIQQL